MNIGHKLRKLFDPDIIASTSEHLHRAFHPVNAGRLWRELESDPRWEALRQRYPRAEKEIHRFGDTRFWIKRNAERAQHLSLDRPPRRRILDLGCGPGFFLYLARQLGHGGVGIDLDEEPIFRDTLALLQVERKVHRIEPRRPLPPFETRFDLITSYLTCFHRIQRMADGNWQTWSAPDWQFFIDDVRTNLLAQDGLLLLEFHPQKNGELYTREVRDLFISHGARLFRSKVFLNR